MTDINAHYLDILQQVVHVGDSKTVQEGIWLVHLYCQVIILSTNIFCQQVYGLCSTIPNADFRPTNKTPKFVRPSLCHLHALNMFAKKGDCSATGRCSSDGINFRHIPSNMPSAHHLRSFGVSSNCSCAFKLCCLS